MDRFRRPSSQRHGGKQAKPLKMLMLHDRRGCGPRLKSLISRK
jgi:hypothetical protein